MKKTRKQISNSVWSLLSIILIVSCSASGNSKPSIPNHSNQLHAVNSQDISATALRINAKNSASFEAAIASNKNDYFIAWNDYEADAASIYLRSLTPSSRKINPIKLMSDTAENSFEPALATVGELLALAYYKKPRGKNNKKFSLAINLYDQKLNLLDHIEYLPEQCQARNPTLSAKGETLVIAWIEDKCERNQVNSIKVNQLKIAANKFAGTLNNPAPLVLSSIANKNLETKNLWNLNSSLEGEIL